MKPEMSVGGQSSLGVQFVRVDAAPLEYFLATGLGSRGGPNKLSNKMKRNPQAYFSNESVESAYFLASGLRSRGGPNKLSNKVKRCPGSYLFH
jgi:hypothetical protein